MIKDEDAIPVVEQIISFLENYPESNVAKICETFGLSYKQFVDRKKKLPDLFDRYTEAMKNRDKTMVVSVKSALAKSAEGYDYEEATNTFNAKGELTKRLVYEKVKHHDVGAMRLALSLAGYKTDKDNMEEPEKESKSETVAVKEESKLDLEKSWSEKFKAMGSPQNVKSIKDGK